MTKKSKWLTGTLVLFLLISTPFIYLIVTKVPPPINEMNMAREALAKAKANEANIYAEEFYRMAEVSYDSAMNGWMHENRKPLFNRKNYYKTRIYAKSTCEFSQKAIDLSLDQHKFLQVDLKKKIEYYNLQVAKHDKLFSRLPLSSTTRKENNRGLLLLKEAGYAYEKSNFKLCAQKVNNATYLLDRTYEQFKTYLDQYFSNYVKWKKQAESLIANSKANNSYAILVDKFDRLCYLYYDGKLKQTFDVDLGLNWIGVKTQRGDKRTPEGHYRVTVKKDSRNTKYYKALLINYPNDEDMARFNASKRNLGHSARIGNLIEVHGDGGKNADWTDGCVALENSDMDILYRYASVGTPVTIVGSLKPLSEIMKD